ncbi:MAG: hypothetical protein IT273_14675 [Chitinophagales bacterium]|nr:hypothetical protein [Chitinophagales bacterium]
MNFTVLANIYTNAITAANQDINAILFRAGDTVKGEVVNKEITADEMTSTTDYEGAPTMIEGILVYPTANYIAEEISERQYLIPLSVLKPTTSTPKKKQRTTAPLWAIILIVILIIAIIKSMKDR